MQQETPRLSTADSRNEKVTEWKSDDDMLAELRGHLDSVLAAASLEIELITSLRARLATIDLDSTARSYHGESSQYAVPADASPHLAIRVPQDRALPAAAFRTRDSQSTVERLMKDRLTITLAPTNWTFTSLAPSATSGDLVVEFRRKGSISDLEVKPLPRGESPVLPRSFPIKNDDHDYQFKEDAKSVLEESRDSEDVFSAPENVSHPARAEQLRTLVRIQKMIPLPSTFQRLQETPVNKSQRNQAVIAAAIEILTRVSYDMTEAKNGGLWGFTELPALYNVHIAWPFDGVQEVVSCVKASLKAYQWTSWFVIDMGNAAKGRAIKWAVKPLDVVLGQA